MTALFHQDGDVMLLILFQNVIPAEVSLVCVVKPDEFWDKKVTHFCFWKEKDRLGFEVSLTAAACETAEGQTSLKFPLCHVMLSENWKLLWI